MVLVVEEVGEFSENMVQTESKKGSRPSEATAICPGGLQLVPGTTVM